LRSQSQQFFMTDGVALMKSVSLISVEMLPSLDGEATLRRELGEKRWGLNIDAGSTKDSVVVTYDEEERSIPMKAAAHSEEAIAHPNEISVEERRHGLPAEAVMPRYDTPQPSRESRVALWKRVGVVSKALVPHSPRLAMELAAANKRRLGGT